MIMAVKQRKRRTVRYLLPVLMVLWAVAAWQCTVSAVELTAGQKNIIARANRQTQIEWIPWRNVKSFAFGDSSSFVFEGGLVFHGLPYGQVPKTQNTPAENGYYVPAEEGFNAFLDAVADPESDFYTRRAWYNGMQSPWFAGDCSSFVSYCMDMPRTTTYGIWQKTYTVDLNSPSDPIKVNGGSGYSPLFLYLADIEYRSRDDAGKEQPAKWEALIQTGDVLNKSGVHTVVITDVIRDADKNPVSIEVSENTPPLARRWSFGSRENDRFSMDAFYSRFNGYDLVRYNYRDVVRAPEDPYTPRKTGTKGVNLTEQYEQDEDDDGSEDPPAEPDPPAPDPPAPAPAVTGTAMTRLYNPATHEHLHTKDAYEVYVLTTQQGWENEGSSWVAPETSDAPVYRLFNPYSKEHFYTKDAYERSVLIKNGWNDEAIGWYSADASGVPVYRLFNAAAGIGAHHYTTDAYERSVLLKNGWADEGIAWYGVRN